MRQIYRLSQRLWGQKSCRWLIAMPLAALLGVAAGHKVIGSFCGSVSVVDGRSMAPTYQPGARVYTGPISSPLQRGDIVLVDDGKGEYALKRVVGLPGEALHLWRGYVFINRKMLREPYLPKHTYTFPDEQTETFSFDLGQDQYFVMGDNRCCSVDSRSYGPVERKQIKSRVPASGGVLEPCFTAYVLPSNGKRTIQLLGQR
jgi:signal peptidase I